MAISKNMIAAAGEYLVCAELCRRNVLGLVTPKNNPLFDVLATDPAGSRSVPIQVKTMAVTNTQGWKFGLDMERDLGVHDMFAILVNLHPTGGADFYVYRRDELSQRVRAVYQAYIAKPKRDGGERKAPPFRWFNFIDFTEADYGRKNRWDLLGFPVPNLTPYT